MKNGKTIRRNGLAVILIAGVATVVVILSAVTAFIGYQEFTAVLEQQYNDSAYEVAETAKTYLNPDKFFDYLSTLEKDEEFEEIQRRLDELTVSTDSNFIYVAQIDPTDYLTTTYIYDSVNPATGFDRYPLGYTITDGDPKYVDDLKHILESGGRAEKYLYSYTKWGAHTTAGLAVKDSSGKVVAVIGVEKTMKVLDDARKVYVGHVAEITVLILVAAVALYALYLRKTVLSPIVEVTAEAERFANNHEAGREMRAVRSKNEIGVLATSVQKMEVEIIQYIDNLTRVTAEKERIGAELSIATQIQADMLPSIFPPFPENEDQLDIAAQMTAAKDVGGDFYDFFRIDDDRIGFVIADVSGKGIPAAIFMAVSRTLIRATGIRGGSPAECMRYVNELLAKESVDCMFVTVFYGIYNIQTGEITYCNAGHNPPYLLKHDGSVGPLPMSKDPMVGAVEGLSYHEQKIQLEKGDALFMFTDGVTEAMNASLEEFGEQHLEQTLQQADGKSCQEVIDAVNGEVKTFVEEAEQSDDITMLVLKRKA